MKKTRINKIVFWFTIIFLILVMVTLMTCRPDWRYTVLEFFRRPDNDLYPEKITAEILDLQQYEYSQMVTDDRFIISDALMLINEENALASGYEPELTVYGETEHKINCQALEDFKNLVEAVRQKCNQQLAIVSGYRNADEQRRIIADEGENAAEVNASEHLTGLSLDVCIKYFGGNAFLKSEAGRFVNSYCGDYGFIIRYPMFSKDITGIPYEPWHIRYVGLPHSKIIQGAKLTLEEYIDYFEIGDFYRFEEYIITRQKKDDVKLPKGFKTAAVSEDNTGCYIITML